MGAGALINLIKKGYTIVMSIIKTVFFTNDLSRWESVTKETHKWDRRNKIIASFIPEGSSVLDVGAGAQTLRDHLSNHRYVPCDVVRNPETLYCDLNRKIYPPVTEKFDYVICSGVVEYLKKPAEEIFELSGFGKYLIISYACYHSNGIKEIGNRIASGWKNHITQKQLEEVFNQYHLTWEILEYWDNQIIYILNRP